MTADLVRVLPGEMQTPRPLMVEDTKSRTDDGSEEKENEDPADGVK